MASGVAIAQPDRHAPELLAFGRKLKLELFALALIVLTIGAIAFQDLLLSKTLVLAQGTQPAFPIGTYVDGVDKGHSTLVVDPKDPLAFDCDLRAGFGNPYCGMEIIFADPSGRHGLDLSQYESLQLSVTYNGASPSMRIFVKNHDPRYSIPQKRETAKFHQLEIFTRGGTIAKDIPLKDFSVADWWVNQKQGSIELTRPQLDNVVSIDVTTGTNSRLGPHHFRINRLALKGRIISPATFYLILMAIWTVLIAVYLAIRIISFARQERRERALREAESERLQDAKLAAERASNAKSAFLSNMSHELRTPLNAILGYAQLLEGVQAEERYRKAARTIRSSGTHLLTLITDVLDLSKIEAGKMELVTGAFDLGSCLDGIAEMIRIRAEEKGLAFSCTLDPALPRHVTGDEKRLRQVLINLLGNAVKFTENGEVQLVVSALAVEDEPTVRFEVRDTGVGLTTDELDLIFQPFEQAGDEGSRSRGTGLGLSISRQLVELMGSEIDVESDKGRGSRFWFDLVLAAASAPAEALAATSAEPAVPQIATAEIETLVPPPQREMEELLTLARAGNMKGIVSKADEIETLGHEYRPFADRLRSLARAFQSPAILRLVEDAIERNVRQAA